MILSWKPNIYASWSTSELRVRLAPWNRFEPSSKIFYLPFQGGTSFVDIFFSVLCLLCLCARVFICALWSPAGKGLTSWLSFMVSNCKFVTFPLVSWVRCGTWLYRFLIFAPLLALLTTLTSNFHWWVDALCLYLVGPTVGQLEGVFSSECPWIRSLFCFITVF